ncbi:MAG: M14 family metallopeptidase, partial [Bacteroidota bacterium]|nr:M14 family metallopeptidase [Bacteroidota bacterium]
MTAHWKSKFFTISISLIILLFQGISLAQEKILSPDEFLGYTLGSRFTPHHKVVDYFNYVSSKSNQVLVEPYGETYEHRPLLLAFISTAENLQNLEAIRKNNLKRAGIINGKPNSTGPAILWFSYNVHGNESVSTEAALATLYALCQKVDSAKQEWLKNTIVIIDPTVNPDGRERYVNFYSQTGNKIPNPNPDSKEHHEPWPGGRANHYLFDLNRDWAWQTQVESKQRMKVYNNWLPHVHVDFHEQGYNSPYYFAPAAEPLHDVITQWQRDFQVEIGKNHSKYFDKNNWLYFTKEHFDLLYPSYGDTYPLYNGAIGMTYEQGGSGRAGLAIITDEKDTLTLKDRIEHHYTTGLSTIEISSINAERIVGKFERFFKGKHAEKTAYKSYVIKDPGNNGKILDLMDFLDNLGIIYGHGKPIRKISGFQYSTNTTKTFEVTEKDLIINALQPKATLLQVLFDPNPRLSDSVTYDITAWGIPYMFGLETFATPSDIAVVKPAEKIQINKLVVDSQPYAYLVEWNNLRHLKFLSKLMDAGIKVRFSSEPFFIDGKNYTEGSLIITRAGNDAFGSKFDNFIIEEAHKQNIGIFPAFTGMVGKGKDFGSGTIRLLKVPKVAVVRGNYISSLAFGEIWHFFEQDINFPITILDTDYLNEINFAFYDVMV